MSIFIDIYTQMLLRFNSRNIWLCFRFLDLLCLSNTLFFNLVIINILIFKNLIFCSTLLEQILIFIMNFFYENSMPFNRPSIIMHPQNISSWILVMIKYHFFSNQTFRIKSHTKIIRKLTYQIISIGIINKIGNIIVLFIYSQFGLV